MRNAPITAIVLVAALLAGNTAFFGGAGIFASLSVQSFRCISHTNGDFKGFAGYPLSD